MHIRARNHKLSLAALVATGVILMFSPAAFAANSSVGAYGGAAGGVQAQIRDANGSGSARVPAGPGSLPFTGFDLGLALGGGLMLLGFGASIAMLTRLKSTEPS